MQNTDNSFAARLNKLFAEKKKKDGTPYTSVEAIERTHISRVELWRLRKGMLPRPNDEVVEALANFFRVSPSYFYDEYPPESLQAALSNYDLGPEEPKTWLSTFKALFKK